MMQSIMYTSLIKFSFKASLLTDTKMIQMLTTLRPKTSNRVELGDMFINIISVFSPTILKRRSRNKSNC